jgi:hypothetical protein
MPLIALVYENEVAVYKDGAIEGTWIGSASQVAWLPDSNQFLALT